MRSVGINLLLPSMQHSDFGSNTSPFESPACSLVQRVYADESEEEDDDIGISAIAAAHRAARAASQQVPAAPAGPHALPAHGHHTALDGLAGLGSAVPSALARHAPTHFKAPPQITLSMAPMNPAFARSSVQFPTYPSHSYHPPQPTPAYPMQHGYHHPQYAAPAPQYAAAPSPYAQPHTVRDDLQLAQRVQQELNATARPRRAAASKAEKLLKVQGVPVQHCCPARVPSNH